MIRRLTLVLLLLGLQMDVQAHVVRHASVGNVAKLKNLLQQLEEAVAQEEASERPEYEDMDSTSWDEAAPADEGDPAETLQRNRLIDLLMATRSKSLSGCFGGRLDRIGSSSTLGCNSKKG